MKLSMKTGGNTLRRAWDLLAPLPGGRVLFSKLVGRLAPYSGTISARVCQLSAGYSRVQMRDRPAVRNHLRSIHAVALVNLAEIASGTALLYGLPDGHRAILTGFSIEYLRKARGTLTAESRCEPPAAGASSDLLIAAVIVDASGTRVATAEARWRVSPERG